MKYLKSLDTQSLGVLGAVLLAAMFMFMPDMALAAGGSGGGGLGSVEDGITGVLKSVRSILLAIIPIAAGIILVWKCWKGISEHQPFSEIMTTVLWIVGAACACEFAVWVFDMGKGIKFSG